MLNRAQARAVLTSGPVNRTAVSGQIHTTATTTYASKSYIDTQDGTFAQPNYYQNQDALNVPLTAVGQPNGVASLDSSGKVPLAQMPALGAGYLLGPFGPTTAVTRRVAGVGPAAALDLCDFAIGVQNITFQPLVFVTVNASTVTGGRTVIEARMSSGTAPYASQTRIARGMGRTNYTDPQSIAVIPCPAATGATPSSFAKTYNIFISLWIYDLYQSSTVETTGVVSASVYLLRTSQ
jgi:hypothetical protein